jgi:hypothetical protein
VLCRSVREEITTWGPSDFKQLQGGDFYRTPTDIGLRVPDFVALYRILLLSFSMLPGDRLVGMRQLLKIGQLITTGDTGAVGNFPSTRDVVTPGWTFQDSFNAWTVTTEPYTDPVRRRGPLDMPGFQFEGDGPSVVYETAALDTTGRPYYLGLASYTAPGMRGTPWQTLREMRYPWQREPMWALNLEVEIPTRVYVYLDLQQTAPETRTGPPNAPDPTITPPASQETWPVAALDPEELFLNLRPSSIYFSAGASAIVERRHAA